MFAIALQENQYKTYVLTDDAAASRVELIPERGGIVTRWTLNDQEIFYLDAERLTHPELTVRGGIPILFPICGNLPDNTYTHAGTAYALKQHGFARELPWTVVDTATEDSAQITLTLTSNDQTYPHYPFNFHLAFTYRLRGNRLELLQQVTNQGAEPMPFSLGFHPYFWAPDKSQLQFELPATEFLEQRSRSTHPFSGSFDLEQEEIDILFSALSAQTASVIDQSRGLKLQMNYDNPYSILVFWTVKGKDFYCLEPWTAARNAMNTGDRLLQVEPGSHFSTHFELIVSSL